MTTIARRSTDQYKVGPFPVHGQSALAFDGTLMRFESTGPFNRELMLAAEMAIGELVAEIPPSGPWAEIVRLHGSALIAMDVMPPRIATTVASPSNKSHTALFSLRWAIFHSPDRKSKSPALPDAFVICSSS
ncbi:MAG: hypothetical protein V4631_09700 [Pseudomonadota bacterium]